MESGKVGAKAHSTIELPAPVAGPSAGLDVALARRRTIRDISTRPLPLQLLSNLLWAAFGVNRKVGPFGGLGRTAASASNSQEIDIYVAMQEGVFLHDASRGALERVAVGDWRASALTVGQRGVAATAHAQLIYVVDLQRLTHTGGFDEPGLHDPDVQKSYYFVDTGMIAQNVHLFAAANGLAAWFHNCDRAGLARVLGLDADKRVLFAQSVGFPTKEEPS